jgi:hypothetical protein
MNVNYPSKMNDECRMMNPELIPLIHPSPFILHHFLLLPLIKALSSQVIILGRTVDSCSAGSIHYDDLGANRLVGCPGRNSAFGHQNTVLVGLDTHRSDLVDTVWVNTLAV